jgi:hypothetical protein
MFCLHVLSPSRQQAHLIKWGHITLQTLAASEYISTCWLMCSRHSAWMESGWRKAERGHSPSDNDFILISCFCRLASHLGDTMIWTVPADKNRKRTLLCRQFHYCYWLSTCIVPRCFLFSDDGNQKRLRTTVVMSLAAQVVGDMTDEGCRWNWWQMY